MLLFLVSCDPDHDNPLPSRSNPEGGKPFDITNVHDLTPAIIGALTVLFLLYILRSVARLILRSGAQKEVREKETGYRQKLNQNKIYTTEQYKNELAKLQKELAELEPKIQILEKRLSKPISDPALNYSGFLDQRFL
jgi:hypothetical protein